MGVVSDDSSPPPFYFHVTVKASMWLRGKAGALGLSADDDTESRHLLLNGRYSQHPEGWLTRLRQPVRCSPTVALPRPRMRAASPGFLRCLSGWRVANLFKVSSWRKEETRAAVFLLIPLTFRSPQGHSPATRPMTCFPAQPRPLIDNGKKKS